MDLEFDYDKNYYKLLSYDLVHRDKHLQVGMNYLKNEKFDLTQECGPGLYFCDFYDIQTWVYIHNYWIATIRIPKGTPVVKMAQKYKTTQFEILSPTPWPGFYKLFNSWFFTTLKFPVYFQLFEHEILIPSYNLDYASFAPTRMKKLQDICTSLVLCKHPEKIRIVKITQNFQCQTLSLKKFLNHETNRYDINMILYHYLFELNWNCFSNFVLKCTQRKLYTTEKTTKTKVKKSHVCKQANRASYKQFPSQDYTTQKQHAQNVIKRHGAIRENWKSQ